MDGKMIRRGDHDRTGGPLPITRTHNIAYSDNDSEQESISSRPRRGTSEVDGMDDYTQQLSGETVAPAGLGRHDATQQTGAQQSYTDALANFFAGVDINDQQQPSGDSFSSMFSGHTKGPEGLDRVENDPKQDFLAGFNPFGSLSSAGSPNAWISGFFGNGEGNGSGNEFAKKDDGGLFRNWGVFREEEEEEQEEEEEEEEEEEQSEIEWGRMNPVQAVPTRLSGMDITVMTEEELEDLYVLIGTRLQEAKESSLNRAGQVMGHYVLRTVTPWELTFWEACEVSLARYQRFDAEYIDGHLQDERIGGDAVDKPERFLQDGTPLKCLLLGVPFNLNSFDGQIANVKEPSSSNGPFARTEEETLDTPLSEEESMRAVHARNMIEGHAEVTHMDDTNPFRVEIHDSQLTSAERMLKILDKKSMTLKERIVFARKFADMHTDWQDVKAHLQAQDPLVVASFEGKPVHTSDLKHFSLRKIKEVIFSRQIELKKRESIIFWCVGRPLPDGYQRCIKRLPIDKQEIIREKLTKVERHGSTALDLRAAAMIIIENGGGYSAAVELKIDMEEPVDCYSKPTPSQMVEIRRTKMMKDYRDGVIDLQEMAHSNYNLTTGSTRAHSVTGGRSKLDTPAKDALLTPKHQVDLYNARYLGEESESDIGLEYARPADAKSVMSSKISTVGSKMVSQGYSKNRDSHLVHGKPIRYERNFELSRLEIFKQMLESKFDKRSQNDKTLHERAIRDQLRHYKFDDAEIQHRLEKGLAKESRGNVLTLAQAIPARKHRDPYAYGGIDGKTKEPIIGWEDGMPYINNFNNDAVVTDKSHKRARELGLY